MLSLFPILLIVALAARDGGMGSTWLYDTFGMLPAVVMLGAPIIAALAATWISSILAQRDMDRGRSVRPAFVAERIVRLVPWMALFAHVSAVLFCGWLDVVRSWTGDRILLDELVAIVPALSLPLLSWWIFYPVERRMREATVIRRLDAGMAVYPVPNRLRYVITQVRLHLMLTLAPAILLMSWSELVQRYGQSWLGRDDWTVSALSFVGSLLIFAVAPAFARLTLDVTPMGPGPVRDDLLAICAQHRVGIRQLLVWHTDGAVINGAVMGLVAPLRYVMLTEALLDSLSRPQLLAVMAHEVGHVRRKHLWWMGAAIIAIVLCTEAAWRFAFVAVQLLVALPEVLWIPLEITAAVTSMAATFIAFGWVSRRFERQADTFAVQHLTRWEAHQARITPDAVYAMTGALGAVSSLNAIDPERPSWRHGSIRWRQDYLRGLIGRPAEGLGIDRLVASIKLATILMILLSGGLLLLPWLYSEVVAPPATAALHVSAP